MPGSSAQPVPSPRIDAGRAAHFVLQGKGGVGKSFVASLIAQFLSEQGRLTACYDTDPVNGSLQSIKALAAVPVALLTKDALNAKALDTLVQTIIEADADVVIDSGASSFLPLSRYLVENDLAGVLREHGVGMVVHTIVTGGGNGLDTVKGMTALVEHFTPGAALVLWVNEYFGPVRFGGTDLEQTAAFVEARPKLRGVAYLRQLDPVMFGPNLASMLERKLTFAEAAASDQFMLMERSRLHRVKQAIWAQLAAVV